MANEKKTGAESESEDLKMNAKEMLEKAGSEKRVVKYGERMEVRILKDTKYFKKDQIVKPHPVMAEQLIKDRIAEKVTDK